ncbi:MAG: kinA, partial [bacterium]|nr:kinA [bacterium]
MASAGESHGAGSRAALKQRGPFDLGEQLRRRLVDLQARHLQVVERLTARINDDSSAHRLGWFALSNSSSAVAMFRNGRVVRANPRWHELSSARSGRCKWLVRDDERGQRSYGDLGSLGASELERSVADSGGTALLAVERSDGKQILRVRLERVASNEPDAIGLLMADDVTRDAERERELASLREEVARRDRMSALGRLAAGVVHDLGNTINALALRLQATGRAALPSQQGEFAQMREAIANMRTTLDRLSRFSGRRSAPLTALRLLPIIDSAVELVRYDLAAAPRHGRAKIAVVVDVPRRLPR